VARGGSSVKLCVISSSYAGTGSAFAAYDTDAFNLAPHLAGHAWEHVPLHKETAVAEVEALAARGYDAFINLCDGAADEDRAGIEVVQTLERLGVAFTGADARFYEPTRAAMKAVCHTLDLTTPGHAFARTPAEACKLVQRLRFPLIVKHPQSYGSIGTSKASRVTDVARLEVQARAMIERFGACLVEEFIDGRELTCLVVENAADPSRPHVYRPLEFLFPPGETFNHFDLKWVDASLEIDFRLIAEPALDTAVRGICARFFVGLCGTGYGRCDLRVDTSGRPHLLEINPNCGIFGPLEHPGPYSTDTMILDDPVGYPGFVDRILDAARRRARRGGP